MVEIVCGLACLASAQAATIDVAPEAAPGIRAIASLKASEFGPGTIIRLHGGHYTAPVLVPLTGTRDSPITIEGGGPIDIDGSIVLDHAAFIIVQHLHIIHASDAGIILRQASHDNIIRDNTIENAKLGIWLGQGAGLANSIHHNAISRSETHGIAIDGVIAEPGRENLIVGNRIKDSGIHGIEVSASYTSITGNMVSGSGRLSTGASGIHIFARSADAGVGRNNDIEGNYSFDNHDASAQDGNGIQIDQWCDDNRVAGNIAADNDGAGIIIFDASGAHVTGNMLTGNMRDPGHSHRHKGELVFASDDEHDVDHTRGATADSNIVLSTEATVAPVLVDVPTSRHSPIFSRNRLENGAHGPIARWANRDITDIGTWNRVALHKLPDSTGGVQTYVLKAWKSAPSVFFSNSTRPANP